MEDLLIKFQCFLNNNGLITNHDWDYEKLARRFLKLVKYPTVKDLRDAATEYADKEFNTDFVDTYILNKYARKDFIEGAEWMKNRLLSNKND